MIAVGIRRHLIGAFRRCSRNGEYGARDGLNAGRALPDTISRSTRPAGVSSIACRCGDRRLFPPAANRNARDFCERRCGVLHDHDHAFCTVVARSIAPPMPLSILPGNTQFAKSRCSRFASRGARDVDLRAANHSERRCPFAERRECRSHFSVGNPMPRLTY